MVQGPLPADVVVVIPRQELEQRLGPIDAADVAFYLESREPIPLELVDMPEGTPQDDFVLHATLHRHRQRLVIVSPGFGTLPNAPQKREQQTPKITTMEKGSASLLWDEAWR